MSTTYNPADPYAGSRETTEGRVYTVTGGDWDQTLGTEAYGEERLVVNMGRSTPPPTASCASSSTSRARRSPRRVVIGYLHTGIEKNTEYRNWTQGTTFVTRMDYLSPLYNEAGYCMASRSCWASRCRSGPRPSACWSWSSTGSPRTWSRWPPSAWRWARSPG
jgi:NADH:ubiquinone oxidoreductase 49 kD subunit 7